VFSSPWQKNTIPKPLRIYRTILNDHVKINNYLKQTILEHRQRYPNTTLSNVKAWHSDWETHKINPKFKPFVDLVTDACKYISINDWNQFNWFFEAEDMWVMTYEENNYAVPHDHIPYPWSCVYYVDVETGCSPIIFEKNSPQSLTIQPKNGMLIIWDGELTHEVPPTNKKRMAISMNLKQLKHKICNEMHPDGF
tara:strand:- start:55 stop:639 length:585 start_codon:yes stop_codon:yes gene_type:complete